MKKAYIFSRNKNVVKTLKESGLPLDLMHFETSLREVDLTIPKDSFVFLDWDYYKDNKDFLKRSFYLIFDLEALTTDGFKEIELVASKDLNIKAVMDYSNGFVIHVPTIRSLLEYNQTNLLEAGMGRFVEHTLSELQRIKKLHEQIVPMRQEDIKGLKIFSKFAAGEASGGEFFDIIKGEQEFILLLSSSRSYVVSSLILSHFELLRSKKQFCKDDMIDFLSSLEREFSANESLSEKDLDLFIAKADLKTMTLEGFHFGSNKLVSSLNNHISENNLPLQGPFFDKAFFNFRLQRGEKMILLSSGVKANCDDLLDGQDIFSFVGGLFDKSPKALVTEIFYQLKKNNTEEFLNYDASAIYIEVDPNVIIQV